MRKGGYGGILRNNCGIVLCRLLGLVEYDDANVAEVYAKLMGCLNCASMKLQPRLLKGILSLLFSGDRVNRSVLEVGGLGGGNSSNYGLFEPKLSFIPFRI